MTTNGQSNRREILPAVIITAAAALLAVGIAAAVIDLATLRGFEETAEQHIRANPGETASAIARGAFIDTGQHDKLRDAVERRLAENPGAVTCPGPAEWMDHNLHRISCSVSLELPEQGIFLRGRLWATMTGEPGMMSMNQPRVTAVRWDPRGGPETDGGREEHE